MQQQARREFIEGNGLETTRAVYVQLAADVCREIVGDDHALREKCKADGTEYVRPNYELDVDLELSLARLCGKAFLIGMGMVKPKPEAETEAAPAAEKKSPILTA